MSLALPLAGLAALLLLGGKKSAPAAKPAPKSAPRGIVTLGEPTVIKTPAAPVNEALEAATLAEQQTRAPAPQASVDVQRGVAQTVPRTVLPAGYSRTQASNKAQPTADHVRTRKGKYDRAVVQSFQTSAGLKSDGLYGPQTVAALRYFGAKNVPAALFKGSVKSYQPPSGG
jgi:hypothetical protein